MNRCSSKEDITSTQQTHEKMLNLTDKGKANQNHNEMVSVRTGIINKSSVGKDVEKREPLHSFLVGL